MGVYYLAKGYWLWYFANDFKKYSDDPQIMIFTTALITNVLIISVLI